MLESGKAGIVPGPFLCEGLRQRDSVVAGGAYLALSGMSFDTLRLESTTERITASTDLMGIHFVS